jgi:cytidylate kinase
MTKVLAIDGPSGAGKGTVARAVARALDWAYVDTGAMYRAVAWKVGREALSIDDEDKVAAVAEAAVFELDFGRIVINGEDVTSLIRTPKIDVAAATVASMPRVRRVLVARQRDYAAAGPVVMDGREIGTVVFPDAVVKLYLDATPEERASRRSKDPAHGLSRAAEIGIVASALATRDRLDRTRQASPLTRADDAILIETTGVPARDVVVRVLDIVRERLGDETSGDSAKTRH